MAGRARSTHVYDGSLCATRRIYGTGKPRFIDVKGRVTDARTVTITKNKILTALNKPKDCLLALVVVDC